MFPAYVRSPRRLKVYSHRSCRIYWRRHTAGTPSQAVDGDTSTVYYADCGWIDVRIDLGAPKNVSSVWILDFVSHLSEPIRHR
jgi:hypothetical protein